MKASSITPRSNVAFWVLGCVCSLAYLPSPSGAVHPGMVAPPKPDDAFSAKGRYSAGDWFSAEGGKTNAAALGVLEVWATTSADAEEEALLRSREGTAQKITSPVDGMHVTPDGDVALPGARTSRASSVAVPVRALASPDQCWVFMHLQKCGGSTVKFMLRRSFGPRYFIYDSNQWKLGDDMSANFGVKLARGETWNVMAGGYTEALRRSEPVDARCRFFTLFRHPIARMVSAYFYCRSTLGDAACASEVVDAKDVDLLTFAKHWGNFAVRQFALGFVPSDGVQEYIRTPEAQALHDFDLKKVAGWYQLKMYLERPEQGDRGVPGQSEAMTVEHDAAATLEGPLYDLLQPAMDLIRHGYAAVGILEQWNTTLRLFDHALEIPGMYWGAQFAEGGKQRVDYKNKRLESETLKQAWTDSELKKYMRLDLLLYEHAVDVFHEQARGYDLL
ncbi:unnamed protein product [Ectocarpus sp. 8 AP-2014]